MAYIPKTILRELKRKSNAYDILLKLYQKQLVKNVELQDQIHQQDIYIAWRVDKKNPLNTNTLV